MSIISVNPYDANRIFGEVIPPKGYWYDIETAPMDTEIIVSNGDYVMPATGRQVEWDDQSVIIWVCSGGEIYNQPTHWMPFPEPPK